MMMFLAKLTQRGHSVRNMEDLLDLYDKSMHKHKSATSVAALPHGTIKRFTPITVAIVGASRRFLAQARTHQVGFNYVSASLQYSDYTGKADFVVPYAIMQHDADAITSGNVFGTCSLTNEYLKSCNKAMATYKFLASETDNDTAGYAAPQGLRNILIIQANHEGWLNFIRARACNRNTNETQYVATRIWEELLKTEDGEELFKWAGPDCVHGQCREGKMFCGEPLRIYSVGSDKISLPRIIINAKWKLFNKRGTR